VMIIIEVSHLKRREDIVIEEEKSPERNTGKGSSTILFLPHRQAQTLIIGIRNGSDTILTVAYL